MSKLAIDEVQFLDFKDDIAVVQRRLPHWSQPGTICFITWRTADSMPEPIVDAWVRDRASWLRIHDIDPTKQRWRQQLTSLSRELQLEYHRRFTTRWLNALDDCHGECVLRQPRLAGMIGQSLRHFNGERYLLTDYVIMPNHIHLLAAFTHEDAMLKQCESWKHYTAREINRATGRSGRFWQSDDFDHLVRSEEQFFHFRRYIADNFMALGIVKSEDYHYSVPLAT
jgi:REP element-mobilizing transposase RayT